MIRYLYNKIKGPGHELQTNMRECNSPAFVGHVLLVVIGSLLAVQQNAMAQINKDILLADTVSQDELTDVYPVLYGTQQEKKTIGAVGYLKGEKIESTPSAFIQNAFSGRIAGLYTNQNSGAPENDGANLNLRGVQPVILVDGIQRDNLYSINPEQIESITVLKDALSAAMLGVRSLSGAILITTRQGGEQGFNIDVTAQKGVSSSTKLPRPLPAYDYARLYNEALVNDGGVPMYSQADLDAYKDGSDPYGHPDINWYDKILEDQASFSRYTINSSGGNEKIHYFVSLDYLDQEGAFKDPGINTYSTNSNYARYSFRSNLEIQLTSRVTADFNLFGRVAQQNHPGGGTSDIFHNLQNTPANAYPIFNPDSTLGGNINHSDNIYGQSALSGYTKNVNSDGYADLTLKREMDDILQGWWVKGTASFNMALYQHLDRTKNFETFELQTDPNTEEVVYQRYGTKSEQRNNSSVTAQSHKVYLEASTGYTYQWGDNALDVMLLYNRDSYQNRGDLPDVFQTLAGRVQYHIDDKYSVMGVFSYSGNPRYESGSRFDVFPAVGAAWNLHNENFFNNDGFLNILKLRGSFGLTGNAPEVNYIHIDRYNSSTGYYFGTGPSSVPGISQNRPRVITTFEKGEKLNIGVDLAYASNRGSFSVDYYRNNLHDLVQVNAQSSGMLGWGSNISQNLGSHLYSGLEITTGWSDQINDSFGYYISGNFSISDSEILANGEPDYPYSWMQRRGQKVGQLFGYVADGYVTANGQGPVVEGYASIPGDLKYKDMNGDGVINPFDSQPIGNQKPLMFYGVDIGFSWKNFSLSFLIQGAANRNLLLTGASEWEFQDSGKGQAYQHHLGRWTPETASDATYPRLSVGHNVNNHIVSDYWMRKGDYLRLKNAEISYSFDNITLGKGKINRIKLFVNGFNLLTFSDFKQFDPEVWSSSYPLQRVVNGGINLKF